MANDFSDPKSVRKAQKQAERDEAAAALYLRTAMATVEGRTYFLRLLERCHIFLNPFATDALRTAFACGEMSIGQQILGDMMVYCPDQYILMMREREDGRRDFNSSGNGSGRNKPNSGWDDSDNTGFGDEASGDDDTSTIAEA